MDAPTISENAADVALSREVTTYLPEKIAAIQAFNASPDDGLFPAGVVCHVLDVAPGTLANLNNAGTGPTYYRRGHSRYYRKADVLEWMMKERRVA